MRQGIIFFQLHYHDAHNWKKIVKGGLNS